MRIHSVNEAFSAELRKSDNVRKTTEKPVKTRSIDRSEFSEGAQRLSNTKAEMATVSLHIQNQPDVRLEKVAEVKEKIQKGYYNSAEFADKLADKLMVDFGLKNT